MVHRRQSSSSCRAPRARAPHGWGSTPRWRCHHLRCEGLPLEPSCGPAQTRGSLGSGLLGCGGRWATPGSWVPAACTGRSRKAGRERDRLLSQAGSRQHGDSTGSLWKRLRDTSRRESGKQFPRNWASALGSGGQSRNRRGWLAACNSSVRADRLSRCSSEHEALLRAEEEGGLGPKAATSTQGEAWEGLWFYISTSSKRLSFSKTHHTNTILKCDTMKYTFQKVQEADLRHQKKLQFILSIIFLKVCLTSAIWS